MLAHTLLNRAVDRHIGIMEEKAVALVNIVHKNRTIAEDAEESDCRAYGGKHDT
jgi:hypothetical protein